MLPLSDQPTSADPSTTTDPDGILLSRELTPRTIQVWSSMLGLALEGSDEPVPIGSTGHRRWSGCIALSGEWRGAVTVSCIEPLARVVTGAMFGIEPAEATEAEIQDAIGELANIIGGQTKQVLGDRCMLGLPVVIEGDNFQSTVPGSHAVVKLPFRCEGHTVEVAVVGANARVGVHRDGHHGGGN
jgi:chemotaxis protein CheX